jgi:aldehyde dehydrogenase (NAD+)
MKADLHKSPFESWATEISLVVSECEEALAHLDEWMAPQATKTSALNWPAGSYTQHDPLGVIHVMGAWNYPVQLTLAPVVGAIAGGNCVLIRPGSYAVQTSHAICRLVDKYLDKECIRVAEGDRHLTNKILQERFDLIVFTGSEFVGKLVQEAAAKHLTPTILELGGKSPTIVDRSAHLTHAAERIVWATFLNSGQTCVRPDFCLVHEEVADDFFKIVKATIQKFYTKSAKDTEYYGRLINPKAFERLADLVEKSKQALVSGGEMDAVEKYIEPTVFDFGSDLEKFATQPIMQDELFGPLLPVARYKKIEDVVSFVRQLPTGKPLALYCYARDKEVIDTISHRTTSGGLCINDCVMHLANHELPFGGVGRSGMGKYHGHHSFKSFTHEKAVLRKYPVVDEAPVMKQLLAARFPPYSSFDQFAVKMFGTRAMMLAVNLPFGKLISFVKKLIVLLVLGRICGYKVQVKRVLLDA